MECRIVSKLPELDSFKVDQLDVLERADEWRPGGEVDEGAGGRLKQHSLAVRNSLKTNPDCFCIVKISTVYILLYNYLLADNLLIQNISPRILYSIGCEVINLNHYHKLCIVQTQNLGKSE